MTVWAETQGRRVNSSAFTWPAFHSCLWLGAGRQRRPGAPSNPNLFSEAAGLTRGPRISEARPSLLATKPRSPWKGLQREVWEPGWGWGGWGASAAPAGMRGGGRPGRGEVFTALCFGYLVWEMGAITVPPMGIFLSRESDSNKQPS